MTYTYNNKGTCSVRTIVELNDDHTIKSVQVMGGCDGNLKGIAKLLPGMKAEDVAKAVDVAGLTADLRRERAMSIISESGVAVEKKAEEPKAE